MAFVRMVQVAADQVIDMGSMRHGFVAAARAVDMPRLMAFARVARGADAGVVRADLDDVLIEVIAMRRVQVAVVQVVDMVSVPDGGVAAARSMHVRVIGMDAMFAHWDFPFRVLSWGMGAAAGAGASLAWASALKTRSRMCWSASE